MKFNKLALSITSCFAFVFANNAVAFDVHTHTAMTAEAIKQSAFGANPNSSLVIKKLGLFDRPELFDKRYIDIGSTVTARQGALFEAGVMKRVRDEGKLTVPLDYSLSGWIIRGAIREDDNSIETPTGGNNGAGDEPGGVFERVYNHFYDPANNRPLTVNGVAFGNRSPDWALNKGMVSSGHTNNYNLPSAREAMWRALTGKTWLAGSAGGAGSIGPDIDPTGDVQIYLTFPRLKDAERKAYWATTFRAIGDVVHLLQDAAQPQHTRNDAHAGLGCGYLGVGAYGCLGGHDSFFEKYLKARTLKRSTFTLTEGVAPGLPTWGDTHNVAVEQLNYSGYTTPVLADFRDYFETPAYGNTSGKGMANFSNRNFYSFGTNINSSSAAEFASPSPTGAGLINQNVSGAALTNMTGKQVPGYVQLKTGTVTDTVFPDKTATNVPLSSRGFFDQFLESKGVFPKYTLNKYNYDAMADLLVPRAVAYSAGVINHFFRGDMQIDLPDEGVYGIVDHADPLSNCKDSCGFKKIKLKLTNITPDASLSTGGSSSPQHLTGGTLVAVAKYSLNSCYQPDMSGEVGSDGFPSTVEGLQTCLFGQFAGENVPVAARV